jgi:hypothetical protein
MRHDTQHRLQWTARSPSQYLSVRCGLCVQTLTNPTSAAIESERKPLRSMLVEREPIIMALPISFEPVPGE